MKVFTLFLTMLTLGALFLLLVVVMLTQSVHAIDQPQFMVGGQEGYYRLMNTCDDCKVTRLDSLEFISESWSPMQCVYGPISVHVGSQRWELRKGGRVCVPSRSKRGVFINLLPTGTLQVWDYDGYVWPIARFNTNYEAPSLVERH